jgi:GDPmannose 4,6-dehydratase
MGIEIGFKGSGVNEIGYVIQCNDPAYQLPEGKEVVFVDPKYFRPAEVDLLVGDASKAKDLLNWTPSYDLQSLVKEMMMSDLQQERSHTNY